MHMDYRTSTIKEDNQNLRPLKQQISMNSEISEVESQGKSQFNTNTLQKRRFQNTMA